MSDSIKMLAALETREVSGVKRPANRRRFAMAKSEDLIMGVVTKAVIETAAEGEAEFVAALKKNGADDKRIEAAVAVYRIRKGFADTLQKDDLAVIAQATGEAVEEPVKKSEPVKPAVLEKLSPEERAQLEAVFKSNADMGKEIGKLTSQVRELIDSNQMSALETKAETMFGHVPATSSDIARVLKSASAVDPKLGADIEKLLMATEQLVRKSGALTTLGNPGHGAGNGADAWSKIQVLAKNLTIKSATGGELTDAQKVRHVIDHTAEGRELYATYLAENPAQRARHG